MLRLILGKCGKSDFSRHCYALRAFFLTFIILFFSTTIFIGVKIAHDKYVAERDIMYWLEKTKTAIDANDMYSFLYNARTGIHAQRFDLVKTKNCGNVSYQKFLRGYCDNVDEVEGAITKAMGKAELISKLNQGKAEYIFAFHDLRDNVNTIKLSPFFFLVYQEKIDYLVFFPLSVVALLISAMFFKMTPKIIRLILKTREDKNLSEGESFPKSLHDVA